jgi:SAM-dependent methyltransferase
MSNGWSESAEAWIASQGESGDFSRAFVLDRPMLARARAVQYHAALDVGCGEGRFARMLKAEGMAVVGLDPTPELIAAARARDPESTYIEGRAEALPFEDETFDLVVSYLSLIDIEDFRTALREMVRVLTQNGSLLIANLTGMNTARVEHAEEDDSGFLIDHYFEERARWEEWRGIRIRNHHRPLSAYMQACLGLGLTLTHFDEPKPYGGEPHRVARYARVPWHLIMEWRKFG